MSTDLFYEYFVRPMTEQGVQGYNLINTTVLISILVVACAVIYFVLRKRISFDSKFFGAMIPYILFGISMRVVMHQIEAGLLIFPGIAKTANPLELGFWFFTPGIWLLTFALVVIGLLIGGIWKKNKKVKEGEEKQLNTKRVLYFGIIVCIIPLLFNFFRFNSWFVFITTLVIILTVSYGICYLVNKFTKYKILNDKLNFYIVLGQCFDGIASAIAIAFFNFSEQHVFSNMLMNIHPGVFAGIKIIIAMLICYSLDDYMRDFEKKNKDEKKIAERKNIVRFVKVIIAILGFATGLASLFKLGIL